MQRVSLLILILQRRCDLNKRGWRSRQRVGLIILRSSVRTWHLAAYLWSNETCDNFAISQKLMMGSAGVWWSGTIPFQGARILSRSFFAMFMGRLTDSGGEVSKSSYNYESSGEVSKSSYNYESKLINSHYIRWGSPRPPPPPHRQSRFFHPTYGAARQFVTGWRSYWSGNGHWQPSVSMSGRTLLPILLSNLPPAPI